MSVPEATYPDRYCSKRKWNSRQTTYRRLGVLEDIVSRSPELKCPGESVSPSSSRVLESDRKPCNLVSRCAQPVEQVWGLLGILKAAQPTVPLNPVFPKPRYRQSSATPRSLSRQLRNIWARIIPVAIRKT